MLVKALFWAQIRTLKVRCYMRRYVLISCLLMALLPLCGCAGHRLPFGLGVDYRDSEGRALDWPRGDNPVTVEMFFILNYNEPVYISVNGGPRNELRPGRNSVVTLTSKKSIPFEVWWGKRVGYDTFLEGDPHYVVGLYTGQPIIIDELFLRNLVRLEFVVANISGESIDFVDGHGNVFTLKPGEDRVLNILAGDYILTWRPSANWATVSVNWAAKRGLSHVPPSRTVPTSSTLSSFGSISIFST